MIRGRIALITEFTDTYTPLNSDYLVPQIHVYYYFIYEEAFFIYAPLRNNDYNTSTDESF